jgi:protein-disulfide isomerase
MNIRILVTLLAILSDSVLAATLPNLTTEIRSRLIDSPNVPSTGPATSPKTLIDFFDYSCPFCRKLHEAISFAKTCDPNLRIVYRHLPLLGPESKMMAKIAIAAAKQGGFIEMHNWLMSDGYNCSKEDIIAHAQTLGLNSAQLKQDVEQQDAEKVIDQTIELALKLNIRTIPAIILNDHVAREAMDQNDLIAFLTDAYKENGLTMPQNCRG